MRVMCIRPIQKGDEVTIGYVDVAGLKNMRQKELRERYKFECRCEECEGKEGRIDPREAFECPEKACEGLLAIRGMCSVALSIRRRRQLSGSSRCAAGGRESICSRCRTNVEVPDITTALDAAKSAYDDAEKSQHSGTSPILPRIASSLSSDPSGRSRRCTNRSLKRHLLPHISHSSSGSLHLPIIPSPSTLNNPAPLLFLLHSRLPIRSIRLAWRIPPVFLRSPSAFNSLKHTSTPRFDPTVKPIPRGGLEVLDEPERAEFRIEVDGGGIEGM